MADNLSGGSVRVAIVHDWLEHYAGSERVFEQLLLSYPQADLYAIVDFVPEAERHFLGGRVVRTSFIQKLPLARRFFRNYIGLMPLAIEQFDFSDYQVVISSSHSVAKGIITGPNQIHVAYVHSPMRYAWDLQAQYLREGGLEKGLRGLYVRALLHRLRLWDVRSAMGVDVFVANSNFIADRIQKVYRRSAQVVAPPVAVERFTVATTRRDAYVVVSRLVPYKRVELIVEAFAGMPEHRLIVVGAGGGAQRVALAAKGSPNIEIRSPISSEALVALFQGAKAFVFAGEEDFGITMVEAQACGTPVIAYESGGARDIVVEQGGGRPTGILFESQTVGAIQAAVRSFESQINEFTPEACRENALRFSGSIFRYRIEAIVNEAIAQARTVRKSRSAPVQSQTTVPDAVSA